MLWNKAILQSIIFPDRFNRPEGKLSLLFLSIIPGLAEASRRGYLYTSHKFIITAF